MFYSKNNKISMGSKNMEIKYLTVKDLMKKGDIVIEHIRTESMLADPLTKGLKPKSFKEHDVNMGVVESFDFFDLVGAFVISLISIIILCKH